VTRRPATPPAGDPCRRLRMRIGVDGVEQGTITGTLVRRRYVSEGANLHRALYDHRQAPQALHEVGMALWTSGGRARDELLEASPSVEALGAWLHIEAIDASSHSIAAEALAQTLRRCGCAAASYVAPPLEGDTDHSQACAALGFARSRRSPEALWIVTQETLVHDGARLGPVQAQQRVAREEAHVAQAPRSVVPPGSGALRAALRAADVPLDGDAERDLCRVCCEQVHDHGGNPDAAGACGPVPRTVNGTGHTGPSRFCATSP